MSVIDELEDLKKRQEGSHQAVMQLMKRIAELEKLIGVNNQSTPSAAEDDDLGSAERPMMVENSDEEYIIVCRYDGPKGPPIFLKTWDGSGTHLRGIWSRFRRDVYVFHDVSMANKIRSRLMYPHETWMAPQVQLKDAKRKSRKR